uniref:Uncharacterized protein n=1 Tax=Lygus hesperus TaxID=30085 RepID=A0A0K8TFM6_LYGHE
MHQKQYEYTTPQLDCWPYQPTNQVPTSGPETRENEKSSKKPKKFRVMKHLRRWIRGSKKVVLSHPSACEVEENREDSLRRTPSEKPKKEIRKESGNRGKMEISAVYQAGSESTRISERTPQVNFKDSGKQTVRAAADMKPLEAFDGSISMPVLVTPDKSCFKTKIPTKQENAEGSKSSTRARKVLEEEPTTYSVVGNSAAIHIAKNRIRLEGKDTKYGSILHKDEHFDDHFKVLQEDNLQDIEHQVNKVKERIMFARYSKGY